VKGRFVEVIRIQGVMLRHFNGMVEVVGIIFLVEIARVRLYEGKGERYSRCEQSDKTDALAIALFGH
jgi:hypothetical protein